MSNRSYIARAFGMANGSAMDERVRLARTTRCAIVLSCTSSAAAISGTVNPHKVRSSSVICASIDNDGCTARNIIVSSVRCGVGCTIAISHEDTIGTFGVTIGSVSRAKTMR